MVLSVGAYYLLRRRHVELARTMIRVALPLFTVLAIAQVALFGANQAVEVSKQQPAKLAAMEGVYTTRTCAPMYILGWTDQSTQRTTGIAVPCLLSFLTDQNFDAPVTGLEATPQSDWPQVNLVFQMYHLMINLGMLFIAIGLAGCALWVWRQKLWTNRWMLRVLVASVFLTELATLSGWWTAEFGRQPWIVWNVLRTAGAQSPNVGTGQLIFSISMFVVLYIVVLYTFLRLLDRQIKQGPPPPSDEDEIASLPDSFGEIFRRRSRVSSGVD